VERGGTGLVDDAGKYAAGGGLAVGACHEHANAELVAELAEGARVHAFGDEAGKSRTAPPAKDPRRETGRLASVHGEGKTEVHEERVQVTGTR
jgi:hypothetical protein